MGRYYSGDINGKFWFGVQSSNDASFFGGEEIEPQYIEYYFGKDDMPQIEDGLNQCHAALGEHEGKLNAFFARNDPYNDTQLAKAMGIPEEELRRLLEWYARLELGKKIRQCVEEKGECSFEAEL